jgi:hypothetical protein
MDAGAFNAAALPGLARISHECGMDLFYDFNFLRRIAPRCLEVLSSTGFSLCGFRQYEKIKTTQAEACATGLDRAAQ